MDAHGIERNNYDAFADRYAASMTQAAEDAEFSFNLDLVIPRLLDCVGPVGGLDVLDAGCGEGTVARLLAGQGARVTAIDVSPRLIELARERGAQRRIQYRVHDLSRPLPERAGAFDLVVSNLVLNDVPDYRGFARSLTGMTKPGGRLLFSLTNPYSAVLRQKVQSYFERDRAVLYPWPDAQIYFFHRTMEQYIDAFRRTGCLLGRLRDVEMDEAMVARLPARSREQPWSEMYHRFPFFIILEFVRPEIPFTVS